MNEISELAATIWMTKGNMIFFTSQAANAFIYDQYHSAISHIVLKYRFINHFI